MNFVLIWAVLISFIILMYILLDGFDLGIGILLPLVPGKEARDIMMSAVIPIWDGNETWLVFGAAALYAAFPLAYGLLLPMLYMPIMIMLLALIFRGVAIEFRFKAHKSQWCWNASFFIGSTVAALMQGMILGRFLQGYGGSMQEISTQSYWLTPFSGLMGIIVVIGYALLGATWLILKTEGALQTKMYKIAKVLLALILGLAMSICLITPHLNLGVLEQFSSATNRYSLLSLLLLLGVVILCNFLCLNRRCERAPFFLSMLLFILSYVSFCFGIWPYIIPNVLTIWEAAAPLTSLKFSLVGTAILVPILLTYTAYAYWVFRGKVTKTLHY